jgi:hypothetical protein
MAIVESMLVVVVVPCQASIRVPTGGPSWMEGEVKDVLDLELAKGRARDLCPSGVTLVPRTELGR